MGTSGTALYEDDTAHDVRHEDLELLANGSPADATQTIVASWAGALNDTDEGPVFWLALADTQWQHGCLSEEVKAAALEVIDSGSDLRRWEGSPMLARRRTVLQRLKKKRQNPADRIPQEVRRRTE